MEEFREEAEKEYHLIRKDIRESKYELLKIIGIEMISVVQGVAFGTLGRATNNEWIPAVPPVIDLIYGMNQDSRWLWLGYVKYGIGVGLVYSDKILINYPQLLEGLMK